MPPMVDHRHRFGATFHCQPAVRQAHIPAERPVAEAAHDLIRGVRQKTRLSHRKLRHYHHREIYTESASLDAGFITGRVALSASLLASDTADHVLVHFQSVITGRLR